MKFNRRTLTTACMALLATAALPTLAQDFPSKPIRMVVGYAVGGPTDVIARLVAQDLQAALGQTVVVENKTGANGNIATEDVARAPADGYTLIVNTLSHNVNALLGAGKVKYDPVKNFAPVSLAVVLPQVLVVGPDSRFATLADLVKGAKTSGKAVISGFHDATGNPAQNAELAKQRALVVRDALMAAGLAESQIELKKPEQVVGSGSDAEARRVEISLQ